MTLSDQLAAAQEERDRLRAEQVRRHRLRALAEALVEWGIQTTEDGVPILPGMTLWRVNLNGTREVVCSSISVHGWRDGIGDYYPNATAHARPVYSTQDAAEKSRAE